MAFRIRLAPRAAQDIDEIYQSVILEAPLHGPIWYARLTRCLYSRDSFPERGMIVASISTIRHTIRKLLFGTKPHVYRIYFETDANTVVVLHVRHGARREPTQKELRSK